MKEILMFIQIIVSALLIAAVILQSRGTEAGISFGGVGQSYRSKKGLEKLLFYATIIFGILFACISILSVLF